MTQNKAYDPNKVSFFNKVIPALKSMHQPYDELKPYPLQVNRIVTEVGFGLVLLATSNPIEGLALKMEQKWYSNCRTIGAQSFYPSDLYDRHFIKCVCLYGPILEEIAFRGLLMPMFRNIFESANMSEKSQTIGSIIGSSLAFSAVHPRGLRAPTFICGLSYGAATTFFGGSLWSTTTAHIVNNSGFVLLARRAYK